MHEEVSEAENDISCLSISFLVVQVIRFSLTGILPNFEGIEPDEKHNLHSKGNIAALYGISVFFCLPRLRNGDGEVTTCCQTHTS